MSKKMGVLLGLDVKLAKIALVLNLRQSFFFFFLFVGTAVYDWQGMKKQKCVCVHQNWDCLYFERVKMLSFYVAILMKTRD